MERKFQLGDLVVFPDCAAIEYSWVVEAFDDNDPNFFYLSRDHDLLRANASEISFAGKYSDLYDSDFEVSSDEQLLSLQVFKDYQDFSLYMYMLKEMGDLF